MKKIITLKGQLEEMYSVENAYALATQLCAAGIYELSDEHKKLITYLSQVCEDFSLADEYLSSILIKDSYESITKRFDTYTGYTGDEICSVNSLSIPEESIEECIQYFSEEGFEPEQTNRVIATLIRMGHAAQSLDEIKVTTEKFSIFAISREERNYFISENADCVYDDYSTEIDSKFSYLIQQYGNHEGFLVLIQHPYIMRLDIESFEDKILQGKLDNDSLDFFENLEEKIDQTAFLERIFERMSTRDHEFIRYRFGLDDGRVKTLAETAEHFGLSRERASAIQAKFFRYCKSPLTRSKKLKDFLEG